MVHVVEWLEDWDSFPAVSKNLAPVVVYIGSETH
jgi:hypothetical protein